MFDETDHVGLLYAKGHAEVLAGMRYAVLRALYLLLCLYVGPTDVSSGRASLIIVSRFNKI